MAYTPPAQHPYQDSPSTATPVYAAALNGMVTAIDTLDAVVTATGGILLAAPSGGNDTATIQAAIDALATTPLPGFKLQGSGGTWQDGAAAPGGGRVLLGPGQWNITNLVLGHRVALEGVGAATALFQISASTGPMITNRRDSSVHAKYTRIANLTLHGNRAGQSAANRGIHLSGDTANDYVNTLDEDYDEAHVVDNVYILNCKGDGIYSEGASANRISNTKIHHCDGYGMRLFQDTHVTHCDIGWSGLAGLWVEGESCTIDNVKSWYSGAVTSSAGVGFLITADTGTMSTCNAQDNTAQGYLFDGAHGWICNGLLADSNSRNNSGTYWGIDIFGTTNCLINGLIRGRFNSTGPGTKGLQHAGSSDKNDITVIAAPSPWGVSTAYSGTKLTSRIVVNGVTQT